MRIFGALKRWRRRRDVVRRLVAYAKTKQGRAFIEAMNQSNIIMAAWDADAIGAECPYAGSQLRVGLPKGSWESFQQDFQDRIQGSAT